eukprot:TRINITY_DN24240_c0_g1_i3.p1 TRINITY_DN24240_c0_g1~~TRINITY_DN24240_c0_g1_i3.p1  ORF type:complete len:452 (-),score=172.59 TRINITY_DN24240_c0_g1_i3:103-1413(-)
MCIRDRYQRRVRGFQDLAMPAPHIPAGEPIKTGKSDDGSTTWEDFDDKTRIQRNSNEGSVIYIYKGDTSAHGCQQYSELKDGTEVTFNTDGSRCQKFPNGAMLEVDAEGQKTQTNPDGTKIQTFGDGRVKQTNPSGIELDIYPDDALYQGDWPMGEIASKDTPNWPAIKRIQKGASTTHYIGADGDPPTDIQIDQNGMLIVRWAKGYLPIADEHYEETKQDWCMQVDGEGNCHFLCKLGTEQSGGKTTSAWTLDKYWKEKAMEEKLQADLERVQAEKRAADAIKRQQQAEKDKREAAAAEERRKQRLIEEEKEAAEQRQREQREAAERYEREEHERQLRDAAELERRERAAAEARAERERKQAEQRERQRQREIELEQIELRRRQEEAERLAREEEERLAKDSAAAKAAQEARDRLEAETRYKNCLLYTSPSPRDS